MGIMVEISFSELKPGDAIGRCGPGTDSSGSGNGHIMLWLGKEGTRHRVRDHGSGLGPKERLVTAPSDYRAFRFVGVEGFSVNPNEIDPAKFPLPDGHYFGNISGPTASHGGTMAADKPYIIAIQTRLNDLGFSVGIADGEFGSRTETAVRSFQAARSLSVDGKVGPDTYRALFTSVTVPTPPVPTEPSDPILDRLTSIETTLESLVSKVSNITQIDTSPLITALTDFLESHQMTNEITPEVIEEAVKNAIRHGTG